MIKFVHTDGMVCALFGGEGGKVLDDGGGGDNNYRRYSRLSFAAQTNGTSRGLG